MSVNKKQRALELSTTIPSTIAEMYDEIFSARVFCRMPNVCRMLNDSEV